MSPHCRTGTVIAATVVVLAGAVLSACGGGPDDRSAATPTRPTPASSSAAASPSAGATSPVPSVTPNPTSPALGAFTGAQVGQALTVAQQAGLAGLNSTTLVVQAPHKLPDFAAAAKYLTPAAKTIFEDNFRRAQGSNGDRSAVQNVFALAFFQAPGSEFTPDQPVKIASQTVSADPTVTTDTSPTGDTRMVVTGTASVGYVGTDPGKGGHGLMVITRTWTYSLIPTGSTVAVDGWHSDTEYAAAVTPAPSS